MLRDIESFIKYFHGQRRRTQWVVERIPAEKANWRPWPTDPSPSLVLRRTAATHLMLATIVAHKYWEVDDYEAVEDTWEDAQKYFVDRTEDALDLLRGLRDSVMLEERPRPDANPPTPAWRYLMGMIECEIEHRMILTQYLSLLNVPVPQVGGVTIETVRSYLNLKR